MTERTTPEVQSDFSLKPFNSFGMDVKASAFTEITSEKQIPGLLRLINTFEKPSLILGGGSNLLFSRDFDGLVVHMATKGIEIVDEDEDYAYVRAMAGENWDDFVQFCISRNYGGLENLSLIPGNVGSAPIQNIGAYGVELKDSFYMLDAVSVKTGEFREFYAADCQFGYRQSVFKGELKGQYIILSVTFKLSKRPVFNTTYGSVGDFLKERNMPVNLQNISFAISEIRRSKLPDPLELGNAGSFFKNPVVSKKHFGNLLGVYPDMPSYPSGEQVKVPAGWLIEKCGWKGFRDGDAGVHARQALVLVNYGNATGTQILNLAHRIMESVKQSFEIDIEPEVNII
jgi:UDP-N-acetylmuramate dehydrogenase